MAVRPVALSGSSQAILGAAGLYHGFSVEETAGATARIRVYDNTSAAGTRVETITLSPNESAREYYGTGIAVTNGVYVEIVSGTVAGSVRVG